MLAANLINIALNYFLITSGGGLVGVAWMELLGYAALYLVYTLICLRVIDVSRNIIPHVGQIFFSILYFLVILLVLDSFITAPALGSIALKLGIVFLAGVPMLILGEKQFSTRQMVINLFSKKIKLFNQAVAE